MFWSLVLEPGKRYSSTVKESFHLSMAALDVKTCRKDDTIHPVLIEINGEELVLCNLSIPQFLNANLNLVFERGSDITFSTNGKATIHLTGYCVQDDMTDDDYSSSEESEEQSFINSLNKKAATNAKGAQKKDVKSKESKQSSPGKRKLEPSDEILKKKSKSIQQEDDDEDDDEDSSLDENELGKLVDSINEDDVDSEDEDEDEEEEEDDDDDDDDDDEEGDENSEAEDEEDSEDDEDNDSDAIEFFKKKEIKSQQGPKSKGIQTPQSNKQNKTPVSNKKQEKTQTKNQLSNGVTPTSNKKDKKKDNQATPKADQKTPKDGKKENATPQSQKKQTVAGGVVIEELRPGNGPVAKPGKMVTVHYIGRLKNNNRVFDQSTQGTGFKFRLGSAEVIKGWDIGVNGMKVGSKRRITCPPGMAYGNKGSPPQIPPNSTLVFDVELKAVN